MSSVLERELTCSICTDILFDPVIFLNCLHTNCGSCAKTWFATQVQSTCPVCRDIVRDAKPNVPAANLLDDFLERNPEKRRTKADMEQCRRIYKPGDAVLPGGGGIVRQPTDLPPRQSIPPPPSHTAGPLPQPLPYVVRDLTQRFGSVNVSGGPSGMSSRMVQQSSLQTMPGTLVDVDGLGGMSGWQSSFLHQEPPVSSYSNITFDFLDDPTWGGPPPSATMAMNMPVIPSQRVIDHLRRGHNSVQVNCDVCHKVVEQFMECARCTMFEICIQCHREGKKCPESSVDGHFLTMQKLEYASLSDLATAPTRQLLCGIFCDICLRFCDESNYSDRRENSYFWHCETCNNGEWHYCQRCVARGAVCTHELKLYTNTRGSTLGHIRGLDPATIEMTVARFSANAGAAVDTLPPGELNLLAKGYVRRTEYSVDCDLCNRQVPARHSYFHCEECADGDWDACADCFFAPTSPTSNFGGEYRCPQGHAMTLVAQDAGPGSRKPVAGPPRVPPEWLAPVEGRRAVAVAAHWPCVPDSGSGGIGARVVEGERRWGNEGVLCFPQNAEIEGVVTAFEEVTGNGQGEVHCWGWYAGIGGIFPRDTIRFV